MSPAHAEAEKSIKNVAVSRTKPAAVWFEKNTPAMLQNIASMRPSWEILRQMSVCLIYLLRTATCAEALGRSSSAQTLAEPKHNIKKPIKIIKLTHLIFITFFLLIGLIFIVKHASLVHGLKKGDMIIFSVTVIVVHTRRLQNQDMHFLHVLNDQGLWLLLPVRPSILRLCRLF